MAFSLRTLIASLVALGKTDEALAAGQQSLRVHPGFRMSRYEGCVRSEAMRWRSGSAGCGEVGLPE